MKADCTSTRPASETHTTSQGSSFLVPLLALAARQAVRVWRLVLFETVITDLP